MGHGTGGFRQRVPQKAHMNDLDGNISHQNVEKTFWRDPELHLWPAHVCFNCNSVELLSKTGWSASVMGQMQPENTLCKN